MPAGVRGEYNITETAGFNITFCASKIYPSIVDGISLKITDLREFEFIRKTAESIFFGGGKGIRTLVGGCPNGFQDFPRNPTLTQNNRKYQTIENAENPDVARVFGVLSFPKLETSDRARISASKTISKDFLEIVLDKSTTISPVASHRCLDEFAIEV